MTPEQIDILVTNLLEGLRVLVREGLITEDRAQERANNQAMALMAEFTLTPITNDLPS